MADAVALDLDDTLFLERDFVRSGFRAVGRWLGEHVGNQCDWSAELWQGFEQGVRGNAFDRVLTSAGVAATPELVGQLVRCYREHRPDIVLLDDVLPALDALALPPERLGVITDGPVVMQRNKLDALGIASRVVHVIYTDAWGVAYRKPHPRAFETFEQLTGCPPERCAYVSDNPTKDFRSPHDRGWATIRIIRPGGLHAAKPSAPGEVDRELDSLQSVAEILAEMEA
jgi:putative hydrolase of the HAD superfamily